MKCDAQKGSPNRGETLSACIGAILPITITYFGRVLERTTTTQKAQFPSYYLLKSPS